MNICVIILTFNEEVHIERCILSVSPITNNVYIIDSHSTDKTVQIASSLGAKVYRHDWKNYADQFQWGVDQIEGPDTWVFRMDADEYLEENLQKEMVEKLPSLLASVDGIYLKRKVFFRGQWVKHGGCYPSYLLRLWKNGHGNIEQRWMDEHIILPPGSKTVVLDGHIVDDNHKGITFWINKHNSYASREAVDLLNLKYELFPSDDSIQQFDDPQAKKKRQIKENIYAKMPAGGRAIFYFFYRYFFKLGFLDGWNGFIWHFMQGVWYRLLVDLKIQEIETLSGGDKETMKDLIRERFGLSI